MTVGQAKEGNSRGKLLRKYCVDNFNGSVVAEMCMV
jgi:hypothetical protein